MCDACIVVQELERFGHLQHAVLELQLVHAGGAGEVAGKLPFPA